MMYVFEGMSGAVVIQINNIINHKRHNPSFNDTTTNKHYSQVIRRLNKTNDGSAKSRDVDGVSMNNKTNR